MGNEDKLLGNKEYKNNYQMISVFVPPINTKRTFLSQHYQVSNQGRVELPLNTVLQVHCWHTSRIWLNNIYTNYMN